MLRHLFSESLGKPLTFGGMPLGEDALAETSAYTKILQYLTGVRTTDEPNLKGVGIVTSFNPSGKPLDLPVRDGREPSDRERWDANMQVFGRFLRKLAKSGYTYYVQQGKYGGMPERSVVIVNITPRELVALADEPEWKQQAVIWAVKTPEGSMRYDWIENGRVIYHADKVRISDVQDWDDYYSWVGQVAKKTAPQAQARQALKRPRKYTMPFKMDDADKVSEPLYGERD